MSGEGAQHPANEIAARPRLAGSEQRAVAEKAYLKSDLDCFGVTVWEMRRTVREALQARPELDRAALLALVEALWREPVHERRMAAFEALDAPAAPCSSPRISPSSSGCCASPKPGRWWTASPSTWPVGWSSGSPC